MKLKLLFFLSFFLIARLNSFSQILVAPTEFKVTPISPSHANFQWEDNSLGEQ